MPHGVKTRMVLRWLASVAVLAAFLVCVRLAGGILSALRAPPPKPYRPHTAPAGFAATPPPRFWPSFPGSRPSGVRDLVLNGIRMLAEDWDVRGGASAVLAYYREQMFARGWSDVTEEAFNLREGFDALGQDAQADQEFLATYDDIMGANAAFQRGGWITMLNLTPGPRRGTQHLQWSAFATPSVSEVFKTLSATSPTGRPASPDRLVLTATEDQAESRWHTRVFESALPAPECYAEKISALKADDWRPLFLSPSHASAGPWFAVFQKAGGYLYLVVNPAREGRGSTAVLSETDELAGATAWRTI